MSSSPEEEAHSTEETSPSSAKSRNPTNRRGRLNSAAYLFWGGAARNPKQQGDAIYPQTGVRPEITITSRGRGARSPRKGGGGGGRCQKREGGRGV